MKLKLASFYLFSLPVNFRLSWGKPGYSRHVFFIIEDDQGNRGTGEGVLYKTTQLNILPFLETNLIPWLKESNFRTLNEARTEIANQFLSFEPAVVFALDSALWDLEGHKEKKPLYEILGGWKKKHPLMEEIFIGSWQNTQRETKKILQSGTKIIKLKIGKSSKEDLQSIKIIMKIDGKTNLLLDANQAYTQKRCLSLINDLDAKNILAIEEPIHGDLQDLANFKNKCKVPMAVDESILTLEDLEKAISMDCFDILNLKLTRLGGITMAQKYILKCQAANKKFYFGCSEELEIGQKAISHLAESMKDNVLAIEGVGSKRLAVNISRTTTKYFGLGKEIAEEKIKIIKQKPGIIFFSNIGNEIRIIFLIKEFLGIWKTRGENLLTLLRVPTIE